MATKKDKKEIIRKGIIDAAKEYSQHLAGKNFLYVYGQEYFEISFPVDHFFFDVRHPYANAKKKLPLPELTNDVVCILKHMQTMTTIYNLSITNLEFTLGLTENIDRHGNKIDDLFLPMSLRVEDSSVEKSKNGDVVDFIFAKDASMTKYDSMLVADKRKTIPAGIKYLLSEKLAF